MLKHPRKKLGLWVKCQYWQIMMDMFPKHDCQLGQTCLRERVWEKEKGRMKKVKGNRIWKEKERYEKRMAEREKKGKG